MYDQAKLALNTEIITFWNYCIPVLLILGHALHILRGIVQDAAISRHLGKNTEFYIV